MPTQHQPDDLLQIVPASSSLHVPPSPKLKKGLIRSVREIFAGEEDEAKAAIKKATSHGAAMMAVGRALSLPSIIVYSFAVLIYMGHDLFDKVMGSFQAGTPDLASASLLLAYGVLVGIMDVAFTIAAMEIGAGGERGIRWHKMLFDWFMVVAVAAIESYTFIMLQASISHPSSPQDWIGDIARGVVFPFVGVFLSTRHRTPPSNKDFERLIQVESGEALLAFIRDHVHFGEADWGRLFQIFALVSHYNPQQQQWVEQLMASIRDLIPANAISDLQAQLERAKRDVAEARVRVDDELNHRLMSALLSLTTTGQLPGDVQEMHPALASFSLADLTPAKPAKRAAKATPKSRTDEQRFFLQSLDITPAKTPAGKKGVWIKSSDLATLTDRQVVGETATNMARNLSNPGGEPLKSGNAYVLPLERAMDDLSQRHLLSEAAQDWWESYTASGGDDESDAPASIGRTGRIAPDNVTALPVERGRLTAI